MKVLLIYFTGTYNTRYLTNKIKNRFINLGDSVDTIEIDINSKIIDTTKYDLIGFGYPIYAFNSPKVFNKYIKSLKFKEGQKYFIYKDSGETLKLNNASSRIIKRVFNKAKMTIIGEYHYVMPYNIRFPFDKKFIKEILVYNEKLLDIMFYNFKTGKVVIKKSNFIYDSTSFTFSVQKPGGTINSFFYSVDNSKCLKCMKCIKLCPENNIKLVDGKIKFMHKCDMCMRCSYYCPALAIKIGILEPWKVNDYYDLDEISKLEYEPYINESSSGFYKCFIEYFKDIDKNYLKIKDKL